MEMALNLKQDASLLSFNWIASNGSQERGNVTKQPTSLVKVTRWEHQIVVTLRSHRVENNTEEAFIINREEEQVDGERSLRVQGSTTRYARNIPC